MSRLLETIRVEAGVVQQPQLHLDRMARSLREIYGLKKVWTLESLLQGLTLPAHGVHKLRVVYDFRQAEATCESYAVRPVRSLRLVTADTIAYSYKWADRSAIADMMNLRQGCDDIIMVRQGVLTDSSYANLALLRDGTWYTPATPLLRGTMRQHLLAQGQLTECEIRKTDIHRYEQVKLINAMLRFDGPVVDASQIVD